MRTKIKVKYLSGLFLLFLLTLELFPFYTSGHNLSKYIRWAACGICLLYLLKYLRFIFSRQNLWVFPLVAAIFISSALNYPLSSFSDIMNVVLPPLYIFQIIIIPQLVSRFVGFDKMITMLCYIMTLWFIPCLVSVFIQSRVDAGGFAPYLLGNKFNVTYFFIIFTCIFGLYKRINNNFKTRCLFVLLTILSVFISWYTYCSTALIMQIIIILLFLLQSKKSFVIKHSKALIVIGVIFSVVVVLNFNKILANETVSNILDIIGEKKNMESRSLMYQIVPDLISQKLFFGYGHNTSIVRDVFAGNSQNGILHIIIQYGIIGASAFSMYVFSCFKGMRKYINQKSKVIIFYIIAFTIASVIEITFGLYFYFLLALLKSLVLDCKKEATLSASHT